MSLAKKANLFSLLSNITSPNHQDAIQTAQLANFLVEEAKVLKYNPFVLTDDQRNYLASMGMQSAPSGAQIHDHPVHKVMESYIWQTKIARLLTKKTTVAFSKYTKFLELQECNKNAVRLVNPCLDVKDQIRYDTGKSSPIVECDTPFLVMHDSGHYYSPAQIAEIFQKNSKLEIMFLTLVVPVETVTQSESFYPELYELRYARDTVIYIPEGHHAGAYEQPLSAHWWLNTNKIVNNAETLGVKRLDSYKAHHVFMVTRREAMVYDQYATYETPDYTILPAIFPEAPIRQRLVPLKMMHKIHDYAKAVKTNSVLNLESKLRHLLVDLQRAPEDTLFLLVHFIYSTINLRRSFVLEDDLLESSVFSRYWKRCKETLLGNEEREKLERYLAAVRIQKFHFTFTLVTRYASQHAGPHTITPDPRVPETFTITQETVAPSQPDQSATEEEEEDTFEDALEIQHEVIPERVGNDCGLVALARSTNCTYAQVNQAYVATKTHVLKNIKQEPNFTNFRAQSGFPWLSGTELVLIAATMKRKLAIHTPDYCRVPENADAHISNVNNIHWLARHLAGPCKCSQKQT